MVASQTPRALGRGHVTARRWCRSTSHSWCSRSDGGISPSRLAVRLETAPARALTFSGATRNSLVVLPLALAMPSPLVTAAVVTQTLVELLGMVVLVRVLPRLLRTPRPRSPR